MKDRGTTSVALARTAADVKAELVDAGGRFAQEFGFSRIAGQVLMLLYLTDGPASLDDLEAALALSKAAVSMACSQLESLGLVARVRFRGDRRRYYRSAENLSKALTVGIAGFVRTEVARLDTELRMAASALDGGDGTAFLKRRVERLTRLGGWVESILGSTILKRLAGLAR